MEATVIEPGYLGGIFIQTRSELKTWPLVSGWVWGLSGSSKGPHYRKNLGLEEHMVPDFVCLPQSTCVP